MVIKDIQGEGYEGMKTLSCANDMLEIGKEKVPMLKISIEL